MSNTSDYTTTTLKFWRVSSEATEEELLSKFEECGEVLSLRVFSEEFTDRNNQVRQRRFGYVTYSNDKDARVAYHATHKTQVAGRSIHVEFSNDKKANTMLMVRNLAPTVTRTTLNDHFARFGKVSNVEIVLDHKTKQSKGLAFVTFANVVDATKACHAFVNSELGDDVRVQYARRERERTNTNNRNRK